MPCSSASCRSRSGDEVLRAPLIESEIGKIKEPNPKVTSPSDSPHTVLRLKRRIDEDPAQVLLMSFKRCKGDQEQDWGGAKAKARQSLIVERVLNYAGTLTPNQVRVRVVA
jgi:hypothetical protein